MMFMFLFYSDEKAIAAMSREERNGLVERHVRYNHEVLEKRATVVATRGLDPSFTAHTVRPPYGVRKGPFAETSEALAGFYLVDCGSLDHALELAQEYPMPEGLGCVEVRPVTTSWDYEPSVDCPASAAAVWALVMDPATWPSWMAGVASATLSEVEPGGSGTLVADDACRTPLRIAAVTEHELLATENDVVPGGTLRLEYRLEPLPAGGTRITTRATIPRVILDELGLEYSPTLYAAMRTTLENLSQQAQIRKASAA